MKKLGLTMTVVALACAAARGEIYYTGAIGSSTKLNQPFCIWNDASGSAVSPQPTPTADDGNVYVFTAVKQKLNGTTFPAKAYLGCDVGIPEGNATKVAMSE